MHLRALEQQIQDLNFQISVILNERQRSSNGDFAAGTTLSTSAGRENGDLRIVTANDAISQHLLSFTDIQVHHACLFIHFAKLSAAIIRAPQSAI